jgi:hypothetical protein
MHAMGFRLTLHPTVSGTSKHPDFLAERGGDESRMGRNRSLARQTIPSSVCENVRIARDA